MIYVILTILIVAIVLAIGKANLTFQFNKEVKHILTIKNYFPKNF